MLAVKKKKTPRDERYLQWLRGHDSCVSRSYVDVVAHHVRLYGWGGVGLKPSDYRCVPLTATEHQKLHHYGEASFWEDVGIDPRSVIASNMLVYLRDVLQEPLTCGSEVLKGLNYETMIEILEDRLVELMNLH